MDMYEEAVLRWLTTKPGVFIRAQHTLRKEGKDWSCPDFVALDYDVETAYVVEVSSAYNLNGLVKKVNNPDEQWFDLLKEELKLVSGVKWKYKVMAFVRAERKKFFIDNTDEQKVEVHSLQDIFAPWNYHKDRHGKKGEK